MDRIHQRLPGVKVGTIFTTVGATRGSPRLFGELNKYSDFVDFTYYPVEGLVRGNWSATWQMLTIEESLAELAHLVERAGNKPFSFTEIGYSASPLNNSSEEKQAEFVRGMFRVLDPYRQKGQIAFILYHVMYDYPPVGAYRMPSSKASRRRPFAASWRIWDYDVTRPARRGKRGGRWSKV